MIDQSSRSQGHKVHNVATRQPCSTVSLQLCRRATRPSRMVVTSVVTRLQPCRTVLLKAIEWSASVMHSIECPASSFRSVAPLL